MKNLISGACVILFVFAFAAASFAGVVTDKLTKAEMERVKNGEVLLKNEINTNSEAGAGIGYGVFHCKLETFWEIIYDYPDYKRMFPPTTYAKVTKKEPNGNFLLDYQMGFMAGLYKINYTSYNKPSADKMRLDFNLDPNYPHDMLKNFVGYWQLEKIGEDTYLAEYKVAVELSLPGGIKDVVQKIVNSLAGKDLPKMFHSVRKEIERREKKPAA